MVSLDAAEEAIQLADEYGICDGFPLDESQKFTLRLFLGERGDGSWAAATVADFEPRQNGKNDTLAARELAGLILFGERLLIHTAHEFSTANEAFLRLVAVFENWDDLRRKVARIRYANGEQGIELLARYGGGRLKYRARTGGSGRGFAKADLVAYDEAQHLQAEHVAASGPTKLANPNSQAWYLGSGGMSTSLNAWRLRKRALGGDGGRFAYVEHTAEQVSLVSGQIVSVRPDVLDREAWAAANSAYGHRISDESLHSLYEELGSELFGRECLCLWDAEAGGVFVLPAAAWAACEDERSKPSGQLSFALDVSQQRDWASIAVGAVSDRGGIHVEITGDDNEVFDYRPGTSWLVPRAVELQARWGGKFAVVKGSPAWSLKEDLDAAKVDLLPISTEEHAQACGDLYDAVTEHQLRHTGQNALDVAVRAADRRYYNGDAWLWSRRTSSVDISPLVAVTLAHWVASKRQRTPKIHIYNGEKGGDA